MIEAGQCINTPLDWADTPSTPAPEHNSFLSVDNSAVVLDTLKMVKQAQIAISANIDNCPSYKARFSLFELASLDINI